MKIVAPTIALLVGCVSLLGGCAANPMSPATYAGYLAHDEARIAALPVCCAEWREIEFRQGFASKDMEIDLGANDTQIRDFGSYRSPVAGIQLPVGESNYVIEIFSHSDKRRGMMRFDDRLFVRPDLVLLNSEFQPVREVVDPPMCWGRKAGSGGIWHRFTVNSPDATYAVISPSVHIPNQTIDTRQVGAIPPGIQMIADARSKTYLSTVWMGYFGLISIRAVHPDTPAPGRCIE